MESVIVFLSYFLKYATTKSITLDTSTQEATPSTLDELYHPSNSHLKISAPALNLPEPIKGVGQNPSRLLINCLNYSSLPISQLIPFCKNK